MDEIQDNEDKKIEESGSHQEFPESVVPESNLDSVELNPPFEQTLKEDEKVPSPTPLIIKAIEKAINQSSNLLFKPFRLSIWLRLICVCILIFTFALINFNTFVNLYIALPIDVRDQIRYEFESFVFGGISAKLILLFLFFIGLCVFIFAGIIFYSFRFVLIELLTGRRKEIAESFISNFRNGIKAYIWSIFIFSLQVLYYSFFIILFALRRRSDLLKFGTDFFSMLSDLSSFIIYLVLISLPFIFINSIFKDFIIPIMIYNNVGVLRSWGKFFKLFFKNLLRFIVYFICLVILGLIFIVGLGITFIILLTLFILLFSVVSELSIIIALFLVALVSLMLLIPLVLFLMPIIAFFRLLPIAFMGLLDPIYKFD